MESNKYITVRGIVVTGWVLLLVCIATILGANLYLMIGGYEVPSMLETWGGMSLGFLFGTFAAFVKDFIGVKE